MKKILIDTNMLLAPIQFRVDIYSAIAAEFYTTSRCIEELEIFSRKNKKISMEAKTALALAKEKKVKIIKVEGKTDDVIIDVAKKNNFVVATNDRELITKLKKEQISVMRLRQKKLVIED